MVSRLTASQRGTFVGQLFHTERLLYGRFKTLKKPSWCPPIPVFPAVWTVLCKPSTS